MEAGFRIAQSSFLGPVMPRSTQRGGCCLQKVGARLSVPCSTGQDPGTKPYARHYREISNSRRGLQRFSGPTLPKHQIL